MPVDPVRRARSISSVEQAAALYAEWAPTYDADVFGELGFTGSTRIAELLVSVLPDPTVPVIDLGCGTGAVGRRLAQLDVTTIDGVDLSPEMLAVAASTRRLSPSHRRRSARAGTAAVRVRSGGQCRYVHHRPRRAGGGASNARSSSSSRHRCLGDRNGGLDSVRACPRREATRPTAPIRRTSSPRRTARGRDVRRPHDRGQRSVKRSSRPTPTHALGRVAPIRTVRTSSTPPANEIQQLYLARRGGCRSTRNRTRP